MVTCSGRAFSPWGESKLSDAHAVKPEKPFSLKERLAEHLATVEASEAAEEAEIDISDEDKEPPVKEAPEVSPFEFVIPLLHDTEVFAPVSSPVDHSNGRPIRTGKSNKNIIKDAKNRAKRRQQRAEENKDKEQELSQAAAQRCKESTTVNTDFSLEKDARVGTGGYSGKKTDLERVHRTKKELGEEGIKFIDWDPEKGSIALLDSEDYVTGVLGGWPKDTDWWNVNAQATEGIKSAAAKLRFTDKQKENRRLDGPSVAFGISFGGGAQRPGNLRQSSQTAYGILSALLGSLAFVRIAGFSNTLFMAYVFQTFLYNKQTLNQLCDWNQKLRRVFKKTAWAACTVNFSPFTVTYPHVDQANLCFGWCAITALGNFDPDYGGHLVLWDLGLAVQFPPGATILIPSALLIHSNIPIRPGEERYSFVQYSSAGIFRWVENGFKSDLDFDLSANWREKKKRNAERRNRWASGLRMFSCWADIQAGNWKGL